MKNLALLTKLIKFVCNREGTIQKKLLIFFFKKNDENKIIH